MKNRRHFLQSFAVGVAGASMACSPGIADAGRPSFPPDGDPGDEEFWEAVRGQYPLTRERGYMNTGGLGPAPYSVVDAYTSMIWEMERISEHGHSRIEGVREAAARFFGVEASEIAFTRNATEGNSTVASGLALKAGDEVIFESHAHPGGAMAWMTRQKEHGIRVRIFEPDPNSAEVNLQRIADLINPRTRVIQVSHITAPTGIRLPVDAIASLARDKGIWFHIDGAQSAGAIPVDLRSIGCDSYATSGHKWMGAPHGTGILYIRHDRLGDVVPTEVGAYSNSEFELPAVFDYVDSAQRYECGTRDVSSVVGIEKAIEFLEFIGMSRVQDRGRQLARHLQDGLREIEGVQILSPVNDELGTAMTTIKVAGTKYDDLYRLLAGEDYRLRCRIVTERGLDAVRISTHIFNSFDECDRAIAGARKAASK